MKRSVVPTAVYTPVFDRLIRHRIDENDGFLYALADAAECHVDTIDSLLRQEHEHIDFDIADRLLCSITAQHLWWTELADIYYAVDLTCDVCKRDGCVVNFESRHKSGPKKQKYCSRKCRQMAHLASKGKVKDARKRNLKNICRRGHKRTPENTALDGACRICDRLQQRKKRANRTPEQIEAKRAYHREYYRRQKAA